MRDSNTGDYGPNLAAYIDRRRGEQSIRAFAEERGLDHARISSWRSGSRPSWEHLRPTADGLGITIGELLVIMGVGRPADFIVSERPPSLTEAIDAIEDETERRMFRDLLAALDRIRQGQTSVTVSSDRRPTSERTGRLSRKRS